MRRPDEPGLTFTRLRAKRKTSSHWGFPLKVWLVTIVMAPFVFVLGLALLRSATWGEVYKSMPFIFLLMFFGLLLLLPVFLLYWILFRVIRNRPLPQRTKRALLSAAGIAAIWLLYYFYDQEFFRQGGFGVYSWPISYSLVLLAAGAVLKMPEGRGATHPTKTPSTRSFANGKHLRTRPGQTPNP